MKSGIYSEMLMKNLNVLKIGLANEVINILNILCAFRDLVPFAKFKKREKHSRRSVIFSKVTGTKSNTSP